MIKESGINKILIIKLKGIGDVVLSTIVLKNLKTDFPEAAIDFLTEPPSVPVLEGLPQINKILLFRKKEKLSGFKTILEVMKNRYDLIIDFYSNPRTALITLLSLAKYRAGFPYRGRKYAYNLFGPSERGVHHSADLHLEFLKSIQIYAQEKELLFPLSQESKKFAVDYFNHTFSPDDFVVAISPSGGWESKKCPPEVFSQIAEKLIWKFRAKILIIWGPEDYDEAVKIKDGIAENLISSVFLAPRTTVLQSAAIISLCSAMISNDSGPMHIASALKTPVLGLFGPTSPFMHGPYGSASGWVRHDQLDCIECNLLTCPINKKCFYDLPILKIIDKFELLIKEIIPK
ncbi:MAG TPA: glycosyltransferase family 9 protein [Ignavibacteriaceae bacterium]|nr:glycosyltransferase family 9 protein [Ignavibacteriaceae bacterium]